MHFMICLVLLPFLLLLPSVHAADDLIKLQSPHDVMTTVERFEQAVKDKGLKVFPRIDHGQAAAEYEQELQNIIVVSFGNPRYGSPLMQKNPAAGIDFPPRVVVYEDTKGQVWLAYNSADHLYDYAFKRHGLAFEEKERQGFAKALENFAGFAVAME